MNHLKKYSSILMLLAGLFLGYLFFSDGAEKQINPNSEQIVQYYTCSMHPQIHQDKPGKCPICGMDLIPSSTVTGYYKTHFELSKAAQELAKIETSEVKSYQLEKTLYLPAELVNDLSKRKQLSFQFSGRIEKLNLEGDGQIVKKGDVLLEIYSPELTQIHRELLEAKRLANSELLSIVQSRFRRLKIDDETIKTLTNSTQIWERFPIKSPKDGIVTQWQVTENQSVTKNQNILVLDDFGTLWVKADVFQSDISFLKIGKQAEIKIGNEVVQSKVNFIEKQIEKNSRTQIIQFEIPRGNGFYPGMIAEVILSIKLDESLVIPKSAVLWTGKQSLVYVAKSETEFELIPIETGFENEKFIQVISGLEKGKFVASNGVFKLDSEAQLAGKISMMTFDSKSEKREEVKIEDVEISSEMRSSFEQVLNIYFDLKDALVASDLELAQNKGQALDQLLSKNEKQMSTLSNWKILQNKSQEITQTQDLGFMRASFISLSKSFIELTKLIKPNIETIYVQFCPMADSNVGANWLSKQEEIRNPYYGNLMLTCGEVIEKIETKN